MDRWIGKVALVTGASSGIGAAIALELAKEGMIVVGVARRKEKLEQVAAKLDPSAKGSIHIKQFDVSMFDEIPKLFETIREEFGGVDVLVNNAGLTRSTYNLTDAPTKDIVDVINTNVIALTVAAREAVADMKRRKTPGHIFNLNSVVGHRVCLLPDIHMQIYCPSKYAVTAINEISRYEMALQESKIKMTSISPGVVDTEIFETGKVEHFEELTTKYPFLSPSDIADAVKYVLGTPENVLISELTIRSVDEKH